MRALVWLLSAWLALSPALADSAYVAPTATGQAATGQIPGTATNDSASAGKVGELITTGTCPNGATTATVTITIASPGVVTWTAHGITGACPVVFTTSSALPTGITAGTTYWVVPSSVTASTFQIATSIANALAGTAITTSGTQSGTQTGTAGRPLTNVSVANSDMTGVSLTAGDWDCTGTAATNPAGTTTQSTIIAWLNSASATLPAGLGGGGETILQVTFGTGLGQSLPIGRTQFSLNATTTIYLSLYVGFGVSTNIGHGIINCRRAR